MMIPDPKIIKICRKYKIKPFSEKYDGNFYCSYRILLSNIKGKIYTGNDIMDKFLNKNKNPPKSDIPKLFNELRNMIL